MAETVLICTLGTEPQVVTASLDLLKNQGEKITEIAVIHTSDQIDGPIADSVLKLKEERANYPDQKFQFISLTDKYARPLEDIETMEGAKAVFRAIYKVVKDYKEKGCRIHFSIAGGRKTMTAFGLATAMILFDQNDDDALWLLYSGAEFFKSKALHPQKPGDAQLIRVPIIYWSEAPPILDFARFEDPYEAIDNENSRKQRVKRERACLFVENELDPIEKELVESLVRTGATNSELAARFPYMSAKSIEHTFTKIFQKAERFFHYSDVKRVLLVSLLRTYIETLPQ